MRVTSLPLDKKRRILARHADGEQTRHEIAAMFAVSRSTVGRVVAEAGQSYARKRRPLTAAERTEIVRRYRAGEATAPLARAFRCTTVTVQGVLHRAGVTLRLGRAAWEKKR